MNWHTPDDTLFRAGSFSCDGMGSDSALVNIRLLQNKYATEIAIEDGVLYRYYKGRSANRRGYGFPLSVSPLALEQCVARLALDAQRRSVPLSFCLCDERQANALNQVVHIAWESLDGDSDYIYKREKLATLSGKKLHKKRNHVHRFQSTYLDWHYEEIGAQNAHIARAIAAQWLDEREGAGEAERLEFDSICQALDNIETMGLMGGVLYADGEPAAMTLASALSSSCVDVHYEKAIEEYAQNGAFAAVNQCFAASAAAARFYFVNREEDMGIEGLRQAKESYYPVYKLRKYYGRVICAMADRDRADLEK